MENGAKAFLGILLAAAMSCSCSAQRTGNAGTDKWTPPDITWPGDLPMSTVPTISKEMIRSIRVGNMPVIFEQTKLEDVRKHFGGAIGNHGDAGNSLAWVCFYGHSSGKPWIFWLTSGEVEGLTWISGFQWRLLATGERADHRCNLLSSENAISLPLPIRLGLSRAAIRRAVGRPTRARADALFFLYEGHGKERGESLDVWNSVTVFFHNGAASVIEADKTTTD